jgi:hypothetical protein
LLLPTLRDPRLHLAAIIVSLQILGQVAFEFQLSIAQILISLLTCAVLEVVITFRWQHVIMWPASALLTGNGIAFILRVPGTEHGDWWSLNGWWIFAGTAAFALLSKYVIRWRGHHVFNPSNIGLVVCFLVSARHARSRWTSGGGRCHRGSPRPRVDRRRRVRDLTATASVGDRDRVLARLRVGIALLAATDHAMTARWHLGPIIGAELWRVLVFSPEILVFLFFMITDPKTIPERPGHAGSSASRSAWSPCSSSRFRRRSGQRRSPSWRRSPSCARPAVGRRPSVRRRTAPMVERARLQIGAAGRPVMGPVALGDAAAAVLVIAVSLAVAPSVVAAEAPRSDTSDVPQTLILPSEGVATRLDSGTAREIVSVALAKLGVPAARSIARASRSSGRGARAAHRRRDADRRSAACLRADVRGDDGGREIQVVREREPAAQPPAPAEGIGVFAAATGDVAPGLRDVAQEVGLRFRQGSFRYSADSSDNVSMMGGGVCWLDFDRDGWLDLFVVNSYSEHDVARWRAQGNLPRSACSTTRAGGSSTSADPREPTSRSAGTDAWRPTSIWTAASMSTSRRTLRRAPVEPGRRVLHRGRAGCGIDHYGWHTARRSGT